MPSNLQSPIRRHHTSHTTSSSGSHHSNYSQDSHSTAPTSISNSPRPSVHHAATDRPIHYKPHYDVSPATTYYPRSSRDTYASTSADDQEIYEEPTSYDPEYEVPEYREVVETNLRPSNPLNFADYFPSTRRLFIRHDDTSYDGNMNLRVDTEGGGKSAIQLFHLRMYDLKRREFSLRRYERSSGREVCHSSRKFEKPAAERRPTLTRSVTSALASIVKPDFKRTSSNASTHSHRSKLEVKRQDSGYESNEEYYDDVSEFMSEKSNKSTLAPTNTTKLEFSNYAQVEISRRGTKSSKRYEFEYWGHTYTWKRVTEKDGEGKAISYHLYKDDGATAVAHIVPELRSPSQVQREKLSGGWVPPCSMFISDKSVLEALTDVADVIISTGLIVLVDDCIKRHFHTKPSKPKHQVSVPLTPLNMEFVTPKAMVEHMFKRRDSSGSAKGGSPLKIIRPVDAY